MLSGSARLLLAGAALAAAGASATDRPARTKFEPLVMSWQAKPVGCSLTVAFYSIGAGIDHLARGRIEDRLERDPAVVSVRPYLRGREGETLLCVRVTRKADVPRLMRALRALALPASRQHPVVIAR